MPDQEHPHTHASYEETFARVATILDVMAEEQLEQQRLLIEQQRLLKDTQNTLQQWIAQAKDRDAETTAKLNRLIERDSETTDKLNGLIDLVDRHIRET